MLKEQQKLMTKTAKKLEKLEKLNELCAMYIMGIINYAQLIFRGKRLGFTEAQIRSKADDPNY